MVNEVSKTDSFLKRSGVWEGLFSNYVNKGEGIKQQGKMVVEMDVDEEGVISQTNMWFNLEGKQSDYTGYAKFRVEGNRLINLDKVEVDPNTGNKIGNPVFDGYIIGNHIHILDAYDDISPDGKVDHRRNSLHYYSISENEIIMIADVYVNDKLFAFANTKLVRKK